MNAQPLALSIALLLPALAPAAVRWSELPFDAALKQAAERGQPLLVDVFAEWCGPCHDMDKTVFSRADVAKALEGTIPLRVDGETEAGKALVARYHVVGYPTVLLIGPDGKEVDRVFGFLDAEAFVRTVTDYRAGKGTLADLKRQLAGGKADLKLKAKVVERLAVRGAQAEAMVLLDEVLAGDPKDEKGLAAQALYAVGRYLQLRGAKAYDEAIGTFTRIRARFPRSKYAKRALLGLAKAWHEKGDVRKTRALLDAYVDEAPGKSGTYNAVAWFCFQEKLDRAYGVAVAERGLKVDPRDAGLLDTLAELLYAQGKKVEALAAIDRAISAAPDEPYYQRQREKFSR